MQPDGIASPAVEDLIAEAQRGDRGACSEIDLAAREYGEHSAAWHLMRRTGLGGSDIAAILGLNPYRRPIDVYADKIGEAEPFEGNERTRWGRILEPVIADEYQNTRGGPTECYLDGPFPTARVAGRPWHLFTIDRLVLTRARIACNSLPPPELVVRVLEIKSRGFMARRNYGEVGSDEMPFGDLCQSAWYVAAVNAPGGADLAALFDTHQLRIFHAERDNELEASLLEQSENWWRAHVVARRPPEPDGSEQYGRYLRQRFDRTRADMLDPDAEVLAVASKLRAVELLARVVDGAKERLRQTLQARIGEASGFDLGKHGGGKLLFKHDSRGRVNHSAVADELARRLELSPKQLKAIQDQHLGRPPRRWYSPRAWLKDSLSVGDLGDAVHALGGFLVDNPLPGASASDSEAE